MTQIYQITKEDLESLLRNHSEKRLVSEKEACRILSITIPTFRNYVKRKLIRTHRVPVVPIDGIRQLNRYLYTDVIKLAGLSIIK